jgi:hypothetical protein
MRKTVKTAIAAMVLLGISLLFMAGCHVAVSGEPRTEFLEARELAVNGRFAEAIPLLEHYLETQPDGKHASRTGLFLGKAHLALGHHDECRAAWKITTERYAETLEGHKCRYKLAFLDFMEGNDAAALEGFRQLAEHPDGPLAPEAKAFAKYIETHQSEGE